MRKTFGYALCVFLLSICSSLPVAAQFIPSGPRPLRMVIQEMPSNVKLRDVPLGAEKGGIGFPANYSNTLANAEQASKLFDDIQQRKFAGEPLPTISSPETAHILIWQASPNLDRKMIREIQRDFSSNMPIFQGLPPASQDFRGMFVPPQLPAGAGQPLKLPLN